MESPVVFVGAIGHSLGMVLCKKRLAIEDMMLSKPSTHLLMLH